MTVGRTITIGWLVVNIPAILITGGMVFFGFRIVPKLWWLFLIFGAILGWAWWSFTVPRWRRWAHRHGVDPEELHRAALAAGLVWPKGSLLERTEFKIEK